MTLAVLDWGSNDGEHYNVQSNRLHEIGEIINSPFC